MKIENKIRMLVVFLLASGLTCGIIGSGITFTYQNKDDEWVNNEVKVITQFCAISSVILILSGFIVFIAFFKELTED